MFDDIIDAKNKLFNAILIIVEDTIKKAAIEAKNQSLDPIQTANYIQNSVDDLMDDIETVLDIAIKGSMELCDEINELLKPYDEAKEIEIGKRVDEILNSETLNDLFEKTEELSKTCSNNDRGYVIKRKTKTLE